MMTSTNGHAPGRAVLYARVSTDEQARHGFSLAQQLEALRDHAAREGYEVLEEVADPGESGAYLERPGLDRVRELAAAGGLAVVLAQDADRISREPWHYEYLKLLLDDHGTELRALDDGADGSPMGEFVGYIRRGMAKLERSDIAKRSRRGKLRKAREGKVVGTHRPRYGFRFNGSRDGYEIDEERMAVVRRVFRMVGAEGATLYAARRALEASGVPSPGGKRLWHQGCLRGIVLDDAYRPHAFGEVAALVSPAVAAGLDPEESYGLYYYDRRRQSKRKVAGDGRDGKPYRYAYKASEKPREGWVAIPVPDAGIPREWVDRAREAVRENRRPSSAGLRFWELSGGVMRCGSCGRAMQTTSIPSKAGNVHHYYRCPRRVRDGKAGCDNARNRRADKVEPEVWEMVSGLLKDPERLRVGLEAMIERKRARLREDPEREAAAWLKKLEECAGKRAAFQDQQAAGLMTLDELAARLTELEDSRLVAERELAKLRGAAEEVEALERDAAGLLAHYERIAPGRIDALSPEQRHRAYRTIRLEVLAHPDGSLEATGDVPLEVSTLGDTRGGAGTLSGPRRS
jgi:site-specific DNA recombinase